MSAPATLDSETHTDASEDLDFPDVLLRKQRHLRFLAKSQAEQRDILKVAMRDVPYAELDDNSQNTLIAAKLDSPESPVTEQRVATLRFEYKTIMGFTLINTSLDAATEELVHFMAYQKAHFYDDDDMDD